VVSGQWLEKPADCVGGEPRHTRGIVLNPGGCYNGDMEATPGARFRWLRLTPDRVVPGLLALEGLLLLAERFGWFTFSRHKGYAPLLAIAAVGAAMALMLLWFLVAILFRRRFQFSLLSLLLLALVVAIPCSWLSVEMKAAREQHALVEEIEKLGGRALYDYEEIDPFANRGSVPPQPPVGGTCL
jgi:hypothetical protein